MNKFNTVSFRNASTQKHESAEDVLLKLDDLIVNTSDDIVKELIGQDIYSFIDYSMRCGLYQGFGHGGLFGYSLCFSNGCKLHVKRLPFGKVLFTLTKKGGYSITTKSLNKVYAFIGTVATELRGE